MLKTIGSRIVWGVFFILAAIFVIASQTGGFIDIGVFSVIATVFLAIIFVQSLFSLQYIGIFVPIAGFYIIYTEPLGLFPISPWMLILSAVLVSVAFYVSLGKRPIISVNVDCGSTHRAVTEDTDDNNPRVKVSLGAMSTYLHGKSLETGEFFVSLGALEVFFDEAELSPEGADIYVSCKLGSATFYIPKHWKVTESIAASLGGVSNDKRINKPGENAPHLRIKGDLSLGGIELRYI